MEWSYTKMTSNEYKLNTAKILALVLEQHLVRNKRQRLQAPRNQKQLKPCLQQQILVRICWILKLLFLIQNYLNLTKNHLLFGVSFCPFSPANSIIFLILKSMLIIKFFFNMMHVTQNIEVPICHKLNNTNRDFKVLLKSCFYFLTLSKLERKRRGWRFSRHTIQWFSIQKCTVHA